MTIDVPNTFGMAKYNCPTCGRECTSNASVRSILDFVNQVGHNHNDNCRKFMFRCPNKHKFSVRVRNTCPNCDWKGKETCECHPGVLVHP
jgi:hypothetical protein